MIPTPESNALELIAKLQVMHPEIQWSAFEIGDSDQYAELGAPEVLVSFGSVDQQVESGLVDAYADIHGAACEPAYWGISEEAAQMIQAFNQVFMAKYPCGDGPRYKATLNQQ